MDLMEFIAENTYQYYLAQNTDTTYTKSLQKALAETDKSISNLLRAIEAGIFNASTKERLDELAERGNGVRVQDLEDPKEIFEGFVTAIDKTFDPRFLFMIMAIVLFLLDIAVRKFKFKWIHEIIRDYKKKKNGEL